MFVAITNSPRDYAWGSTSAIAEFLGRAPSGGPEAELWLGAHAGSPSVLVDAVPGSAQTLDELVAADPSAALGQRSIAEHGARLPFLLKVLAAAGPLSLQAHPTPAQAQEGFARENAAGIPLGAPERNYKDPFHKPELIVAVSERFEALCGFRAPAEVGRLLAALQQAEGGDAGPSPLAALQQRLAAPDGLSSTVAWLLRGGAEVGELVQRVVALAAELQGTEPFARELDTVGALAAAYPGDPGIVLALLLNRVSLTRGQALYLPAGNIHAYLDGLGIELMAASDNVLRGGLTSKHIDVDELVRVLSFEPVPVPMLQSEPSGEGVQLFRPDVSDFVLYSVEAADAVAAAPIAITGPAIALCTAGTLLVRGRQGSVALGLGDAVFVTPDEAELLVSSTGAGTGSLVLATVG